MSNRFARTELLIGPEGLEKLKRSRVAVFGVGGVGSFTVEALARTGIGHLVLVDFDEVCVTNINRQLHALTTTLGRAKVELMQERVLEINPEVKVKALKEYYTPEKHALLEADELDYIVDAIDDVSGKIDLIKNAVTKGIPIVSAMGAGNKLDPVGFAVADISETSVCPLARVVRRELRNAGILEGVKVVYSKEKPKVPESGSLKGKQPPGSISFVPPVMGMILAGVAVRDILGIE